jgi:2,3-bisphosphoglycerate-dependent phosphoglycerate mutase
VSAHLTLHFVRHGQSRWNAEGRLQGQTADVALTELGRGQASDAAAGLASCGATRLISSDLRRAVDTAAFVADVLGVTVEREPALREQSLGEYEGRLSRDVWAEPDHDRWGDPLWRPPGGESIEDVYLRLQRLLCSLAAGSSTSSVVLVSHGDAIRIALAVLRGEPVTGIPWVTVANGEIITVSADLADVGVRT